MKKLFAAIILMATSTVWSGEFEKFLEKKDYAEAVRWLKAAAEQGDIAAQYNLGVSYSLGKGVAQDNVQSVRWYTLAAEQGFALAQYRLGLAHYSGVGVAQDNTQAVRWHMLAAAQGHVDSFAPLGAFYSSGDGIPQNYIRAHMWLNLAAARKNNTNFRKLRDLIAKKLTLQQLAQAQNLATECLARNYKGCD